MKQLPSVKKIKIDSPCFPENQGNEKKVTSLELNFDKFWSWLLVLNFQKGLFEFFDDNFFLST